MDSAEQSEGDSGAQAGAGCANCGRALVVGARFCGRCGSSLDDAKRGPRVSRLVVLLLTFGWLFPSLLIISEPSPNLLLWVFELYAVIGLSLAWLFVLLPAAFRTIKSVGLRGVPSVAEYLGPFPVAVAVLIAGMIFQLPLQVRLELGEGALLDYAERVEAGEPEADSYHIWRFIGVFQVHQVYKRDGCVIFVTDQFGVEDEGGLAHCTGRLPCGPTVEMDHIRGNWWTWNYWSTNERC